MGDANFMGGLLGGLSNTLQQQQEFRQKQELQKSMIDINKLHGKLYEAQVKASDLESSVLANAVEKIRATEQGQGGIMPITDQIAAGQTGLPATGPPTKGFGQRLGEGMLKKKYGLESTETLIKPYGDHSGVFDKNTGSLLGVYPGQGKVVMQEITLPGGATAVQPMLQPPSPLPPGVPVFGGGQQGLPSTPPALGQPSAQGAGGYSPMLKSPRPFKFGTKIGPGGEEEQVVEPTHPLPGEGYQSKPAKKQMLQTVPEEINKKITLEYDPMIRQLDYLKSNYIGDKGEDKFKVFGAGNQLKFEGAENKWVRKGMEWTGIEPSAELIDFHKTLNRLENFEVHNLGGSALTYTELKRALKQIPRANNPKDFAVAVDAATRAYQAYKDSVQDFYSKPESARGVGTPMPGEQTNSLPAGAKPTNRTSNGRPVFQLPDGRYVVQ